MNWIAFASLVFCSVLVDFLHFHPAVLEPDLDLPLGEVEQSGHLVPTVPGEVHVEQEFFLQFQCLVLCIRAALLPCGASVEPVGSRVTGIDGGLVSAALILSIVFGEGAFAGLFFSINCRPAPPPPRAPGGARRGGGDGGDTRPQAPRWRPPRAPGSTRRRTPPPWTGSCKG